MICWNVRFYLIYNLKFKFTSSEIFIFSTDFFLQLFWKRFLFFEQNFDLFLQKFWFIFTEICIYFYREYFTTFSETFPVFERYFYFFLKTLLFLSKILIYFFGNLYFFSTDIFLQLFRKPLTFCFWMIFWFISSEMGIYFRRFFF